MLGLSENTLRVLEYLHRVDDRMNRTVAVICDQLQLVRHETLTALDELEREQLVEQVDDSYNLTNKARLVKISDSIDKICFDTKAIREDFVNLIRAVRSSKVDAHRFFYTRSDLEPWQVRLAHARTLDILGLSLYTIVYQGESFAKALQKLDIQIRILLSNPDNQPLQQEIARRRYDVSSAKIHARNVNLTLACLREVQKVDMASGSLTVKVYNFFPSFSYVGTDTSGDGGRIDIELYLSEMADIEQPLFTIYAANDPIWFGRFRRQFEFYWKYAKEPNLADF
ncbi:MAG: MarR family transcriptional regulator [Anaerolineae bacterium]|nr:MarR family transcriptional regulator [Anaerolineae bacterium]